MGLYIENGSANYHYQWCYLMLHGYWSMCSMAMEDWKSVKLFRNISPLPFWWRVPEDISLYIGLKWKLVSHDAGPSLSVLQTVSRFLYPCVKFLATLSPKEEGASTQITPQASKILELCWGSMSDIFTVWESENTHFKPVIYAPQDQLHPW